MLEITFTVMHNHTGTYKRDTVLCMLVGTLGGFKDRGTPPRVPPFRAIVAFLKYTLFLLSITLRIPFQILDPFLYFGNCTPSL